MLKINCSELTIDHIVEFNKENTIFVVARENGNGHRRIFLINELTGNIYARNGRLDSWEQIYGSDRDNVLTCLTAARNNHTPVYSLSKGERGREIA